MEVARRATIAILAIEAALAVAVAGMALSIVRRGGTAAADIDPSRSRLAVLDRSGATVASRPLEGRWTAPCLAPEGARLLAVRETIRSSDIWLLSLGGPIKQLTGGRLRTASPLWLPDGRSFAYTAWQFLSVEIRLRNLDSGTDRRVAGSPSLLLPDAVSGRAELLFTEFPQPSEGRLFLAALNGAPHWRAVSPPEAPVVEARLSPDGRFLAYTSGAWRRDEIYVAGFAQGSCGAPRRISTDGGFEPRWSRSGKELFYVDRDGFLAAVAWSEAGAAGPRRRLFPLPSGHRYGSYDVDPEGRFVFLLEEGADRNRSAAEGSL